VSPGPFDGPGFATPVTPLNTWRDQQLNMLRDALSPVDFATSWTAGERLDPDVLVKQALTAAHRTETDVKGAAT
jgi:hypothetical protein